MSITFDENDHPRASTGRFTKKLAHENPEGLTALNPSPALPDGITDADVEKCTRGKCGALTDALTAVTGWDPVVVHDYPDGGIAGWVHAGVISPDGEKVLDVTGLHSVEDWAGEWGPDTSVGNTVKRKTYVLHASAIGWSEVGDFDRLGFGRTDHEDASRVAELLAPLTVPAWRKQEVVVEGRRFTMADLRNMRGQPSTLMHGTRANLEVGDVLEPGKADRNFKESAQDAVSLCSDEGRAAYWARESGEGPVYVYEVEPLSEVQPWRVALADYGRGFRMDEGRVGAARIVAKREVQRQ